MHTNNKRETFIDYDIRMVVIVILVFDFFSIFNFIQNKVVHSPEIPTPSSLLICLEDVIPLFAEVDKAVD